MKARPRHRPGAGVPLFLALLGLMALLTGGVGCGDTQVPAGELGAQLFADPALSTSRLNRVSCQTCHSVAAALPAVIPDRFDAGYNLAGAAGRPSWWGGNSTSLLDAVNVCLEEFMGGRPLTPDEPRARQLGAYLFENSPPDPQPAVPFTIVRLTTPLPGAGDAVRGAQVWVSGCQRCHGAAHSGSGRLDSTFSIVPEDTIRAFPQTPRHAVVEKVRHGRFFGIGGVMPLYSLEALDDAALLDLLAYLGL